MTNHLNQQAKLLDSLWPHCRLLILAFSLVCISQSSVAQNSSDSQLIDSLIMRLSVLELGEEKADVLNQISDVYYDFDWKNATDYAQLSLNLSKKTNYKKGELEPSNRLGELKIANGIHVSECFEYFDRAVKLAMAKDNQEMELKALTNIALAYSLNKDFNESIRYYFLVIDLASDINDKASSAGIFGELGKVLLFYGDITLGLFYFESVLNFETENEFRNSTPANLFAISNG